jgi:hypothetical protein
VDDDFLSLRGFRTEFTRKLTRDAISPHAWHGPCINKYVLASSDAGSTSKQVKDLPVELFGYYRS